jgi:hypothetical protein
MCSTGVTLELEVTFIDVMFEERYILLQIFGPSRIQAMAPQSNMIMKFNIDD